MHNYCTLIVSDSSQCECNATDSGHFCLLEPASEIKPQSIFTLADQYVSTVRRSCVTVCSSFPQPLAVMVMLHPGPQRNRNFWNKP